MSSKSATKNPVQQSTMDIQEVHLSEIEMSPEHKVYDGDDALKILHTHFEPFTKEEEKKVLRKIDSRMVPLMLFVNGIQFLDKQVISILPHMFAVPDLFADHFSRSHVWAPSSS